MGKECTNYQGLKNHYQHGIDYKIRAVNRGGAVLILAPHGGGIERGTSELTRAIAGEDLSFYIFEGLMPTARESLKMHITSTRFDEPKCLGLIIGFQTSLAIHGCCGREPMIYIGGRDRNIRDELIIRLAAKGYPVQTGIGKYAGSFLANICNRTSSRKGVQFELSNGFRYLLFDDWSNCKGRKTTTELFRRFVFDIRCLFVENGLG